MNDNFPFGSRVAFDYLNVARNIWTPREGVVVHPSKTTTADTMITLSIGDNEYKAFKIEKMRNIRFIH